MTQTEFISYILEGDLTQENVNAILDALKFKKYIVSAVVSNTKPSETVEHFLTRFWNYDESPYVREKLIVGQSIHRRYTDIMLGRAKMYWIPRFGDRSVGSITRADVQDVMWTLAGQAKLAAETVNQIVRSGTCALKWAYRNSLTPNDCFSGLTYLRVIPKERSVPSIEEARKIFSVPWKDKAARLANITAMYTGMRIGEVQALQIGDIGRDRIFVRHSWARIDGLKCPKNGERREIKISADLRKMLLQQGTKNPYGNEDSDFIFWGDRRNIPRGSRHWNEALKEATSLAKIKGEKHITFHCWRHFFASYMADHIDERKLQLATGHKSKRMLEHYAAHESEETLCELAKVSDKLFSSIVRGIN